MVQESQSTKRHERIINPVDQKEQEPKLLFIYNPSEEMTRAIIKEENVSI
jgi:hypothetical protein